MKLACVEVIVIASDDGEYTFWVQMLVFAIVAAALGVYSLVRTRARRLKEFERDWADGMQVKGGQQRQRDLVSGMEVLELEFLVGVVEGTEDSDVNDVVMRRLVFDELARRGELSAVGSKALKRYAKDEEGVYGKKIQCEAMQELAARTMVGAVVGV